jgi:NADH dehydrogenase [ubiquinone] 1 alpha subcomplex assembly factor 7
MSALAEALRRRIAANGPITVAQYMEAALHDPRHGYYRVHDPFGREGDFVTAPEISQMFGELLGAWCVATWQQMGAPDMVHLVEIGPGRGTLMADALRASAHAPEFAAARRVHLVETSPALRALQQERLADTGAVWRETLDQLPDGPVLVLANELFDALPVRQLVRRADTWVERRIGLDETQTHFRFLTDDRPSPATVLVPAALADAPEGSLVEVSPAMIELMDLLARRLVTQGGAALIIDYGPTHPVGGETLQAIRAHHRHDVLDAPGEADLTTHVDFSTLARTAREAGADVHGPVAQGELLRALGIEARTEALAAKAAPRQREALDAALARLTGAEAMGVLFKGLAVTTPGLPVPAGFEAAVETDPALHRVSG